jgi:hypothetical protein
MLMDDTVLFATSRQAMIRKLNKLTDYCASYGMTINMKKTKFIAMNTCDIDPFVIECPLSTLSITRVDSYCYLGALISDNTIRQQVQLETRNRAVHERKFTSFLTSNRDAPYPVKLTVWRSAMLSALTYGIESWWTNDISTAASCYMRTLKQLLGVRLQTSNDLCLIETGLPALVAEAVKRQRQLLTKMRKWSCFHELPLKIALDIAHAANSPMWRYYQTKLSPDSDQRDPVHVDCTLRSQRVTTGDNTRAVVYRSMNSELSVHPVYRGYSGVPEYKRIALTRCRLSSHSLAVERGRWSRIPREQRT